VAEHQVDAVVIGAGPGGYHAAIRLGQLGKSVICIDRDEVGGVCLNWGCIPTKALLHVGEVIRHIDHAADIGLKVPKADVDREGVAKFKTDVVSANVNGVKTLFKANTVQFLYGDASFKDPTTIVVKNKDGGTDTVKAQSVVIATGSAPIDVKAWPHDGEYIINSDDAVQMKRIPKNMLIVGGGVIGLEFATVYTRVGAKVLVVEALPQILTGTDIEISKTLGRILKKQGVEIMLDTKVAKVEKAGKIVKATINGEGTNGKDETREFDMVLVAVGRRPVTDTLNLAAAGLATDDKGFIAVDAQCRTKVSNIFAIGDVTGRIQLAHVASMEGIIAVTNAVTGDNRLVDYKAVPNCVYTSPEVSSVGLTEGAAKEKGYDVTIGKFNFRPLGKAMATGEQDGFVKVVCDRKYGEVLGVHMIGAHVTDMIHEGVVALKLEATLEYMIDTMHAHPTMSEAVLEAFEDAAGHAIHK